MSDVGGRLADAMRRRVQRMLAGEVDFGVAIQLPGGARHVFGEGPVVATIVASDARGASALGSFDLTRVGEAYLSGSLDVEGDLGRLLSLRRLFRDRHPLQYLARFLRPLIAGQVASDKAWISEHYDEDPEFFLLFLDSRHRCYSQAVFERDDEPLEDAMTRKLDWALGAVRARPGDRVLDIGGGWGAMVEHAGKRGIHVTSLTISEPSRRYVQTLIERDHLPCEVRFEHFFDHHPEQPYDAIVNLGVTEHLPDYAGTLRRYHDLLKPGGRVYLDASAARVKHDVSTFFERHIFPGNGSTLSLRDYMAALSGSPLEIEAVHNDRRSYGLTCRHWAQRWDRNRELVEQRWGLARFRAFRLYLWGCVDGFGRDALQAYRLVLRRRPGKADL